MQEKLGREKTKIYLDTLQSNGFTFAHEAAFKGSLPILKTLVENGADVTAKTNLTPLFWAIIQGNTAASTFLIDYGSDLWLRDNFGNSMLFFVKNVECAQALLDKIKITQGEEAMHIFVTMPNNQGRSAWNYAMENETRQKAWGCMNTAKKYQIIADFLQKNGALPL